MTIKNNKIGSRPVIEPDEKIIVNPRIIISKRGSNHVYERFESPRLGDITLTIDDVFNSHRYSLVSTQAVGSEGVIVRIIRNYATADDKIYTIESGNPDLLNLYQHTAGATVDDFGTVSRESSITKTLAPSDTEIQFRAVYVGPSNGSVTRADLRVMEGSAVLGTLTIPLDTTPATTTGGVIVTEEDGEYDISDRDFEYKITASSFHEAPGYLESLTNLFEVVPTDEYTSDVEQGLMDLGPPLPADS